MDDITLIQHFIKGDLLLVANSRLSIHPTSDMVQLLSRDGKLIAWAEHANCPANFAVRTDNVYAQTLNQALLAHEYMPLGLDAHRQFTRYAYHPIPRGYDMNYTVGRILWKYWWVNRQALTGAKADTEILVFAKQRWSRVTQVNFQEVTLFVDTVDGELALQSNDSVVWAKPFDATNEEDSTVFFCGEPPASTLSSSLQQPMSVQSDELVVTAQSQSKHNVISLTSAKLMPQAVEALQYVQRCSEHKIVIETPKGKVVVVGDRLDFRTAV